MINIFLTRLDLEYCYLIHLSEYLFIEADIKYTNNSIKYSHKNIDNFYEHEGIKEREIIGFNVDLIKSAKFSQVSGFVNDIEDMLLDYYKNIVQNLKSWEKPAPKIQELKVDIPSKEQ